MDNNLFPLKAELMFFGTKSKEVEYVMRVHVCVCPMECQGKVELLWFRFKWVFSFGQYILLTYRSCGYCIGQ